MKMTLEEKKQRLNLEPNSKPLIFKRILSIICDFGMVFLLFFAAFTVVLKTPLASTLRTYQNDIVSIQAEAMLETNTGDLIYLTEDNKDEYSKYTTFIEEGTNAEYVVVPIKEPTQEQIKAFNDYLDNHKIFNDAVFGYNLHSFLLFGLTIGVSELIFFLIVPLCNKKRATIGQLLCGIALFSKRFERYGYWYHPFVRFLFIFIVETLLSYFIGGSMVGLLMVALVQTVVMFFNKDNRNLTDLISGTKLIEALSYEPMVDEEVE